MSISCALLATSLQQWARRYIRLTQAAVHDSETRVRRREFFKTGADKMKILLAVELLPTLLHLSLFLFFGGLGIFLFNANPEVFAWVVGWIGIFSMLYGLITLLPLICQDSPYYTPLSTLAWFLSASLQHVISEVCSFISCNCDCNEPHFFRNLWRRYRDRIRGGMEKGAEKTAVKRSSKADGRILTRTINALGDDESQEEFFEAVPAFFNSELDDVLKDFPLQSLNTFWRALEGFMGHTSSSLSVSKSVKSRRYTIFRNIMSMIPCPKSSIIDSSNLRFHYDEAPATLGGLQAVVRWTHHTSSDVYIPAKLRFVKTLIGMEKLDDQCIKLANEAFGLRGSNEVAFSMDQPKDNVIFAILIGFCRQVKHDDELGLLTALSEFEISRTLITQQRRFCSLWDDLVREARSFNMPVKILSLIRNHYSALHPGARAFPSTDTDLLQPSSYLPCDTPSHTTFPGSSSP